MCALTVQFTPMEECMCGLGA